MQAEKNNTNRTNRCGITRSRRPTVTRAGARLTNVCIGTLSRPLPSPSPLTTSCSPPSHRPAPPPPVDTRPRPVTPTPLPRLPLRPPLAPRASRTSFGFRVARKRSGPSLHCGSPTPGRGLLVLHSRWQPHAFYRFESSPPSLEYSPMRHLLHNELPAIIAGVTPARLVVSLAPALLSFAKSAVRRM